MTGFIEVTSKDHGTITRTLTYFHIQDSKLVVDREIVTKLKTRTRKAPPVGESKG
jgi:hypothetical protein